jgi:predicted ATPase
MAAEDAMITQVRIQNFRSLADVTVDLDPLTVLIGRSGTGKTNFVQAIRFLRDSLSARTMNTNALGGPHRVLHVDHQNDPLEYNLRFSITGIDSAFAYRLRVYPTPAKVVDEYLTVGDKVLFHQADGKWVKPPEVVPAPQPQTIMLGGIPGVQESIFAYIALRSGIGCYDFPGEVLTGPGNQGAPPELGLTDRAENYLLVADKMLSDLSKAHSWQHVAKGMQAINRRASRLTLNAPNPDRLDVGYQLNGKVMTLDVRQESEGFRRYLAHMLALYQNPSKQTVLFEHPEAALHPGALEALAYEFRTSPQDGRGQVVLTTHSPQLLDYFPAQSLRVVDVDGMETRIGPVAPEQMESLRERLLQPGELLTVDPARLPGQLAEVPE